MKLPDHSVSALLLAGGKGLRMGHETPKQFLMLHKLPIALHSLQVFLNHPKINEIIVVCPKEYRCLFSSYPVIFADPGERRQDSVYQGLQKVSSSSEWIITHDAARPFITKEMLTSLLELGYEKKACAFGVPAKNTLKQIFSDKSVEKTLHRDTIWEVQTPQFIEKNLLEKGFIEATKKKLTVTDDLSLVELTGHPVHLLSGPSQNIKITTPQDLLFAQCLDI